MKNYEVFLTNPLKFSLLNNGVSKVVEIADDNEQLKTLRFELETFVCDGEYARGLERILTAYLDGLNKPDQQAAWVSGFFGSGKSHLVKMLRYLWVDFIFPDGASSRSIARLPSSVNDLFVELSNRARRYGGLKAGAGTLGAGNIENVRLAFLQLVFRATNLPENLSAAQFVLWLRERRLWDKVIDHLKANKRDPNREIRNFYVSTPLAEALTASDPTYGTAQNALAAIRSQFPVNNSPTVGDTLDLIRQIFNEGDQMPCTLLAVDEIQQFIGENVQRAMDVQEIAEHCCAGLQSRLLLVGTGQSALTGTASLSRLQARFTVKVSLSDADVENVIRKTILAKKPEKVPDIKKVVETNQGEISRHLNSTRLAATASDDAYYASDYPLLPVRRRFWEKVLRNVDASGTTAQLRTQLKIVFEAARKTAEEELGNVVPADFIYDEIATDLLNTGILQREYHETITGLRDNTRDGLLKSRLCALIFLIPQLPRSAGADDGVRAMAETLADLLVEDIKNDGAKLRQDVPKLLDKLVAEGKLMLIENEYCLQTREGATWNHEFNRRRIQILNNDSRLSDAREEALKQAVDQALHSLAILQGLSRQSRKLEVVFSTSRPPQPENLLVLWIRHGWAEQEKIVANEARAAGNESPMLFGFLPRVVHEELRQHLASLLAAKETIDARGVPTTPEAIQACNAIKTHLQFAEQGKQNCLQQVLADAKVFLGGGNEANGVEVIDKVKDSADGALQRLFPQFADADHANWSQVLNGARAGNVGALQSVGYQGETVRHPVCKQIYDFVGPGKRGKEIRDRFKSSPFGWPQDAIDAALVILILSGNLRCTVNGQPADARSLTQTQIGNASFYQDVPPLTVTQRLDLKALFQVLGVQVQSGQESQAAVSFLEKLVQLASSTGGEAPQPDQPNAKHLRNLQTLSGNAQLLAIHEKRKELEQNISQWRNVKNEISERLPRWHRLEELYALAAGLPIVSEIGQSMSAIKSSRSLLDEPDPVPPLIQRVVGAFREVLNKVQAEFEDTHRKEKSTLETSLIWGKLNDFQRQQLIEQFSLQPPPGIRVADEDEILETIRQNSLSNRRTQVEALPHRFQRALEEAARFLLPKATRITLPSTTIQSDEELEAWLKEVRELVQKRLREGPVIL